MILIQEIIRYLFYASSVYAILLGFKLIRKNWGKKERSQFFYNITTLVLLISLGNIIIFNIDMYNAIIGNLQIHTIIYLLLFTGGVAVIYFLRDIVNSK